MKCSEGLDARKESVMDDSQISGLHNQKRASKYSNKKTMKMGFPVGTLVESTCQSGDTRGMGSIPGLEWSPRVGNGNPLHYFDWEVPRTEPGGLQSIGSRKSQTHLSIQEQQNHENRRKVEGGYVCVC